MLSKFVVVLCKVDLSLKPYLHSYSAEPVFQVIKKRLTLFLIIAFLSISAAAFSTHIVGGTLNYIYNGGSSYTVTLKLFRDCSPGTAAFPASVTINIAGYNGAAFTPSKDIVMNLGTVTTVPPSLDPCAVPPNPMPCVQQAVYTLTVNNLPPNPGGYHLTYQVVARNVSLSNVNAVCNCIGESIYANIPGTSVIWDEDFALANNTTADNGSTGWTISAGTPAPAAARVNNNLFEITGANSAQETWSSQIINSSNCSSFNAGINLSQNGTLTAADSILVYYRLNGGPLTLFPVNGFIAGNFAPALSIASGLSGSTIQIVVRVHYAAVSAASKIYRFDNVIVSCNNFQTDNNPVFNQFPPLFLCAGQPFSVDHSASDADGDSLVYSFYTPYNGDAGAGPLDPTFPGNNAVFTPIVWTPGFSASNPLGGAALNLNPSTGLLTGIPGMLGQFVVGVMVKEYRNGVYIGQTLRDFQFNVVNCTQPPPPYAGNDLIVNQGCSGQLSATGYNPSTVIWNSIFPGTLGMYNNYLSCTTGCVNPIATGQTGAPPYVDYQICGMSSACNAANVCDTVRVILNSTLVAAIVPQNPTICFGQTSTTITVNGSGGTPPYSYLWNTGSTSQSINAGVGTFSVLLQDASNCPPASASVTVTSYSVNITANAGNDITVCGQNPIASLNGSVAGASGGIWSGGAGVFNPNNTTLYGASYTPTSTEILNGFVNLFLTTTGNGTCPSYTDPIVIHFSNFNASVSTAITNVSCYGGNDGSAAIITAGGSNPFTYFWNTVPVQSTSTAVNLTQGTYSVTIQDGLGCSHQISVNITQPLPLSNNSVITNVSCAGVSSGSIAVTPIGGTAPYTYLWSPGNQTASSIINQPAGTYTVAVMDAKGCQITSVYIITQPTAVTISLTSTNVSCFNGNNGTVNSTVSGGTSPYTYNWSPTNASSPNITALQAGNYTLIATDNKGCIALASTSINQPTALAATISSNNETCDYLNNGSASALVSGGTAGYAYLWLPGGQTTSTASNLSSGTYTLTVTDFKGCAANSITTINQPPILTVSFINQVNVTCYSGNNGGITANASGGNPNYTYSWMPGSLTNAVINNLAAGTYTAAVTDNNGCQVQNTVTITQPFFHLAVAVSSSPSNCYGGANGTLSSSASGGSGPYSYNWMPGNFNGQNVLNIPGGNYTVTVTDSKGCIITNTVSVSQPGQIILTTASVNSNCSLANGQASVSVSGGISPFTYMWSPSGGTNNTASGLTSGAYNVFVYDAGGCSAVQYVNVNDNTAPSVSIFSTSNVSCSGGSNGTATVGVAGGAGPFLYSWTPYGGNGPTAVGLAAGIYTVSVIDINGCQSLATTSPAITQPTPITINLSTTNVSCFGGNNGTASASAQGGTGPYTYQWLPGGTMGPAIGNLSANTHTIKVTDANNCVQTSSFTISQPAPLSASITSSSNVSCFNGNNGTATVNTSGGTPFYNYSWLPGGGNGSTGTGLSAGTYTVNITDSKGCTTWSSAVISQPSMALSAASTTVAAKCFGSSDGSAALSPIGGTPAYAYQWSPSGGIGQTASGLSQGSYFVLITDSKGCAANISLSISQPSQITGTLVSTSPSCGLSNGSIYSQISGGTGPYNYFWLPGSSTNPTLNAVGPGTYTLQVTDSKNCVNSFFINLTNIAGPSAAVASKTDVSCFAGNNGTATINITQGTSPFYISWSPYGGNNLSASSLTAGTYNANITDALGCNTAAATTISQPNALIISASGINNVLCSGGNNGSITVAASGGTPAYNYSWQPMPSNLATVNNLTAGTYTVNVTDQKNCPASISINITQPTGLSASIGSAVNTTCYNGADGSASVIASGGTLPYIYSWSTSPAQTGSTAVNLSSGTGSGISYIVLITDGNGCTQNNSVIITHPSQVITSAGPDASICLGQTGTVTASASGGTGNYYYAWLPTGTVNSGTLNTAPSTNTTYTVIAFDQNGCAGTSDTVSVITYNLTPANIDVIALSPICPGQSSGVYVQISGITGPLTYSWNDNFGNGPGVYIVTPLQPTTYIVTVTNVCGSSVTDSVRVLFSPPPTVAFTSDPNIVCIPTTIHFDDYSITGNSSDPISTWYWNFGDGMSSWLQNPAHEYKLAGTYTVTLIVTTENGCTNDNSSSPVTIYAYPYPGAGFSVNSSELDVPYDILVCNNHSTDAALYSWSFGDGSISTAETPQHIYLSVGIFQVQLIATSQYGCSDTAYSDITTNADVIFPNAFTPNTNGGPGGDYEMNALDNDIFFPYTTGVEEFKLEIFNRWGEQIFESTDIKKGWDGYYRGVLCQTDVYVWKAYIKLNNGKIFNKSGDITLLR